MPQGFRVGWGDRMRTGEAGCLRCQAEKPWGGIVTVRA